MAKERRRKYCTASRSNGTPCTKWARNGFNVCHKHGAGTKKNPGGRPVKHGLYSIQLKKKLKKRIERYKNSDDLTDLRGIIATKKALFEELIRNSAKRSKKTGEAILNIATINNAVNILDAMSRDIERLEKIEHGIKHTISINIFHQSVSVIVNIIDRNVPDDRIKNRIFRELEDYGLGKDSKTKEAEKVKV